MVDWTQWGNNSPQLGGMWSQGFGTNGNVSAGGIGMNPIPSNQFNYMAPGQGTPPTMFGMDLGKFQAGLGGLQTLGNLWNSFQGNRLAKDQFKTAKDFATKNLANQIKSYNTALTDRITSRASSNGLTQEQVDQYIKENRM